MVQLYPRLRLPAAENLASELVAIELEQAVERSAPQHPDAAPAATGGQAVTPAQLSRLQELIREEARAAGYPARPDLAAQQRFDVRAGRLLVKESGLSPSEATRAEVWAFMGCVLLPDVVRWRFPGSGTTTRERFLGGGRGTRNALGRLWWRAYLLRPFQIDSRVVDPIEALSEDEIVQIMERPGLSGYQPLAQETARSFLSVIQREPGLAREALMRGTTRRLRRALALVAPETMEDADLRSLVAQALQQSAASQAGAGSSRVRLAESKVEYDPAPPRAADIPPAPSDMQGEGKGSRDPILEQIVDAGLEWIDRRDRDGRLWVIGGQDLQDRLDMVGPENSRWVFAPQGSRATGKRPAWYVQLRRRYARQPGPGTTREANQRRTGRSP